MSELNETTQTEIKNKFFNDSVFLLEVLSSYENTLKQCIDKMMEALNSNDGEMLSKMSHKLKGSTLNFLNSSTTQHLSEIEKSNSKGIPIQLRAEDVHNINLKLQTLVKDLKEFSKNW